MVFPVTKEDVSHAVQAASFSRLGWDLAFVGGAYGQTNASSTTGFLIDLSWMNSTQILHNAKLGDEIVETAIAYQGGAAWKQVTDILNGTGYAAVGARIGEVGVGGFSTGGGIGFLAGSAGYAIDRLRAAEVVLMSGKIVLATKSNEHSDLFLSLQGGGGQFGIVTTFYQEAVPEPASSEFGIWLVAPESWNRAREVTVDFFNANDDPFSLMYYSLGYYPENLQSGTLRTLMVLVGIRSADPQNPKQKDFNATFSNLIDSLVLSQSCKYDVPYGEATELSAPFFPYGFRRGFYGPQTSKVTKGYITAASTQMEHYINSSLARGEVPDSAVWVLQYMFPDQNGHAPRSDADTAWPHARSAHQSLFSPAWNHSANDQFVLGHTDALNKITYDHQASLGTFIADYPNYISPKTEGHRVWGNNVERLIRIKAKYDPKCRIHQGRVFASAACIANGWANVYPRKS